MIVAMKLVALNDGRKTFVRPSVKGSVLDITFASPNVSPTCVIEQLAISPSSDSSLIQAYDGAPIPCNTLGYLSIWS